MGGGEDFHTRNIAVVKEEGHPYQLKIFDLPNLIGLRRSLYGSPPESKRTRMFILNHLKKRADRLEEYEKWLNVTDAKRLGLDRKYGVGDRIYSDALHNLLQLREQL